MTSLLTREEMHNRVDSVFDQMEEATNDECLAIIGKLGEDLGTRERDGQLLVDSKVFYGDYVVSEGAFQLGEEVRRESRRAMFGTLVIPRNVTSQVVDDAVFGEDEFARQALSAGDPEAYDG